MITIIDVGIPNALAFKIFGDVSENDVSEALSKAKELGERYEQITIYMLSPGICVRNDCSANDSQRQQS